jgi:hypothetical protein
MTTKLRGGMITFEASAKREILSFFDKSTDEEDYIIEDADPTQRVLTPSGEELTIDEFAGIKKGSEIFIKSDLPSLIELLDMIN